MIAVQLYSIRDHLQDPARVGGVLARLREIGYRAVEVAGLGQNVRAGFGKELERAGLIAFASHSSLGSLLAEVDDLVAECREWGCRYVVVPALPDEYRTGEGYRRFAAEAVAIAETLRRYGLQLVYHNHSHELERFGEHTGLETLLAATAPETLKFELDTYWLQFGGASPSAWIRRCQGRVPMVHYKDMGVAHGSPVQVEVGNGNFDWVDILNACRDAGTEWLVVEQDESTRDSLDSVAISYANLEKYTAKVGWGG